MTTGALTAPLRQAYFVLVDISNVADPGYTAEDRGPAGDAATPDVVFCRWLARVVHVGSVPASPFFGPETRAFGSQFIRFCFAKDDATMDEAIANLDKLQDLLHTKQ